MQTVMIQGARRGIGRAFVDVLEARGYRVIATCRTPEEGLGVPTVTLDLEDEASIAEAARQVGELTDRLHLLINVSGVLHGDGYGPEKRIEHLDPPAMQRVFAVNAFGPALVAKHFLPLLSHDERAVLANVSARVGSIEDNRLGGWYTYRASKAAQNQFTRTTAIEFSRRAKKAIVVAIHPGTVATELSAPFRRNVPAHKLFSPDLAARQMLDVLDGLSADDTGRFFAWDGSPIPW